MTATQPGFVTLVALYETYWILLRVYGLPKEAILAIFVELLSVPNLVTEQREAVERALAISTGFADALIHFVGRTFGCTKTVTFDKKFARLKGVELLTA